MYTERLQLLLSREQRRRLNAEAKRRGASVASLIREAIDARFGATSRKERLRAVEEVARMKGEPFLSPPELERIFEEEREVELGKRAGARPR